MKTTFNNEFWQYLDIADELGDELLLEPSREALWSRLAEAQAEKNRVIRLRRKWSIAAVWVVALLCCALMLFTTRTGNTKGKNIAVRRMPMTDTIPKNIAIISNDTLPYTPKNTHILIAPKLAVFPVPSEKRHPTINSEKQRQFLDSNQRQGPSVYYVSFNTVPKKDSSNSTSLQPEEIPLNLNQLIDFTRKQANLKQRSRQKDSMIKPAVLISTP